MNALRVCGADYNRIRNLLYPSDVDQYNDPWEEELQVRIKDEFTPKELRIFPKKCEDELDIEIMTNVSDPDLNVFSMKCEEEHDTEMTNDVSSTDLNISSMLYKEELDIEMTNNVSNPECEEELNITNIDKVLGTGLHIFPTECENKIDLECENKVDLSIIDKVLGMGLQDLPSKLGGKLDIAIINEEVANDLNIFKSKPKIKDENIDINKDGGNGYSNQNLAFHNIVLAKFSSRDVHHKRVSHCVFFICII